MAERLTRERTRYWQQLEKLLKDTLIKVSAVASPLAPRPDARQTRRPARGVDRPVR